MFKKLFSKSKFHLDSTPAIPSVVSAPINKSFQGGGGGVGAGAGVRPLAPLHGWERYAAGVAMLAAAAAPKWTSRAVGPAEKRRCCVRSAWTAECVGSGVGCNLTPCGSLLLCHPRGRRSGAEPSPGLDCAERTLLLQPRLLWLASSPTQRRAAVYVCEH